MLTRESIEQILQRLPGLAFAVLGDLFLDRYLDLDAALTEPSIETGLDAYQVTRVRSFPGAAGTVIQNLAALGVGRIIPIATIGDDGEGYELRQALARLGTVDARHVFVGEDRRTPTYTKPMLCRAGQPPRELNRLDIKNRHPLPPDAERRVVDALTAVWPTVDGLLVLDQVSESDCGVVTARVRARLAELGAAEPGRLILADSRERCELFQSVWLKPNRDECLRATGQSNPSAAATHLARRTGRPVFCTCGDQGILVASPSVAGGQPCLVPAFPVRGPIDIVGAGDSTSAAIACAVAARCNLTEAASFGNLVASITIQQIGVTGTATPQQVKHRWEEVSGTAG